MARRSLMVTHDSELAARVPRTLTLADGLFVDAVRNPKEAARTVLRPPLEPEMGVLTYV